jgi:hypothetical protein
MQNSNLVWYNSVDMFHVKHGISYDEYKSKPGFQIFRHMFGFFAANFAFIDRTRNIKTPLKTSILPQCEMPEFKKVNLNLDELCQSRARNLLNKAKENNKKLAIMYSGGIDSTLIMVSLLKIATPKELKENVVVLLSIESILENKSFYKEHILKKCILESSYDFYNYLGHKNYIVISGESGDQLFGSAVCQKVIETKGKDYLFSYPTYEKIFNVFAHSVFEDKVLNNADKLIIDKIIAPLNVVIKSAPIEITTVYHYFWWLNFTLKWQSVYARTLSYTSTRFQSTIKPEENYFTFFNTTEMQLWCMNNPDKLIKDTWESYKYIAKDIINDYHKDEEYRKTKLKNGSLIKIIKMAPSTKAITSDFKFHNEKYPNDIWENNNSFV